MELRSVGLIPRGCLSARQTSVIFDIRLRGEFDGSVTLHHPVLPARSIQPYQIPAAGKGVAVCGWKGEQAQGFPHLFTFPGLVLSVFSNITTESWASLVAQIIKNLPASQEVRVQSLGWEDPLEKKMATHSNILAWRVPWTEEPGGRQSLGSQSRT